MDRVIILAPLADRGSYDSQCSLHDVDSRVVCLVCACVYVRVCMCVNVGGGGEEEGCDGDAG